MIENVCKFDCYILGNPLQFSQYERDADLCILFKQKRKMYRSSRRCTKCIEDYWSIIEFVLLSLCPRILENNVFTNNNILPSRNNVCRYCERAWNEKAFARLVYRKYRSTNSHKIIPFDLYHSHRSPVTRRFCKWLNIESSKVILSIRKGFFQNPSMAHGKQPNHILFGSRSKSNRYPVSDRGVKRNWKIFSRYLRHRHFISRSPVLRVDKSRGGSGRNLLFKISFNYFNMIAARYPRGKVVGSEIFWSILIGLELKYLCGLIERNQDVLETNIFIKILWKYVRTEMEAINYF